MQDLTRRDVLDEIDQFEGTLKTLGINKGDEDGEGEDFSPKKAGIFKNYFLF